MKLKELLEQLNQLAKERPEALEMEIWIETDKEKVEMFREDNRYIALFTRIKSLYPRKLNKKEIISIS